MTKAPPRKDRLEINEAILEVIALTRGEVVKNGVSVQTQLAEGLPFIQADRVQLQQVILNLIINAVEAMSGVSEGSRELLIGTAEDGSNGVLVAVQDSGPGTHPGECRPPLRRLLHDQARRHGHGTIGLPFDHRSSRGTDMGLSHCRPGRNFSVHPARRVRVVRDGMLVVDPRHRKWRRVRALPVTGSSRSRNPSAPAPTECDFEIRPVVVHPTNERMSRAPPQVPGPFGLLQQSPKTRSRHC